MSNTATVTIVVNDINDAPIAEDNVYSVEEGGLLNTGNIITDSHQGMVDRDADGDQLFISHINGQPVTFDTNGNAVIAINDGVLTINQDGTFSYQHNGEQPAPVSFSYTVTDNQAVSNTATVTIVVNDVNDAPAILAVTHTEVSEEGLNPANPDYVGIPDDSGSPEDKTNSAVNVGLFTINDPDNDVLVVSLGESPVFSENGNGLTLTSGNKPISWVWDPVASVLIGSIGTAANGNYQQLITIALTEPQGNGSGDWGYTVSLLGPIDHPDTTVEDVINGQFDITVSDGNGGQDTAILNISFEDDRPAIVNEETVVVTEQDIPITLVGDFSLHNMTNAYEIDFNGFTITGKGFTSSTDLTLTSALLYSGENGIGVQSVGSPYHNIAGEVDFRTLGDQSASEEVIFTLDPNTVAYGVKIEFAAMFGGSEDETGVVEFYRNGDTEPFLIVPFTSDTTSGDFAANFEVNVGFDKMIVKATDNGKNNSNDNSDFTIKGVEFIGEQADVIAYANGEFEALWGADGPGSLELLSVASGELRTIEGLLISTQLSANTIQGVDENNNVVFEFVFTPATGEWDFLQYVEIQVGGNSSELIFNVQVTDGDGDNTVSTVSVTPLVSGFIDDNEHITINEDSGVITGNVIDGVSSNEPISVVSFTIAGNPNSYLANGADINISGVGMFSLESDGTYIFSPAEHYFGDVPVITYQMKDSNNFQDESELSITVDPMNDPVIIVRTLDSRVAEKGLDMGTFEGADKASLITDSGVIEIDNPDGDIISIVLSGPEGLTSNNQAIEWEWNPLTLTLVGYINTPSYSEVINIELSSAPNNYDGTWSYDIQLLDTIDHNIDSSDDNESIQIGVHVLSDSDNEIATSLFTVNVEDDNVVAQDVSVDIEVDSFVMSGIQANWIEHIGGGDTVNTFDGNNDSGKDQIRWGVPYSSGGSKSGYGFEDNDDGLAGQLNIGEDLFLGTFTHYNNPLSGSSISSATMQLTFQVTDSSGNEVDVTVLVTFSHDETSGSNNPPDIIMITNIVGTFNDGLNVYEFTELAFVDSEGNRVELNEPVYTAENGNTEFKLIAQIDLISERPSISGSVVEDGYVLGADQEYKITEIEYAGTSFNMNDNGITINGVYGDLFINSLGEYVYTLTSNASEIPQGETENFTYTVIDADGDSTSANFTINLNSSDGLTTTQPIEEANETDIENTESESSFSWNEYAREMFENNGMSLEHALDKESLNSDAEVNLRYELFDDAYSGLSESLEMEFRQEIELVDVNNLTQYIGTEGEETGMISHQSEFEAQSQLAETNASDVSRYNSSQSPKELQDVDSYKYGELLP